MCHEFEGWFRQRRGAQSARSEQKSTPVRQRPVEPVEPVEPAPVLNVVEQAPPFPQREKEPA